MQITYKNNNLERVCTDASFATRRYGKQMAEKIHMRIDEIRASDSFELMIQFKIGKCHSLTGERKGQYAVDLVQPFRLVFEQVESEIRIANILEIVDYH